MLLQDKGLSLALSSFCRQVELVRHLADQVAEVDSELVGWDADAADEANFCQIGCLVD